MSASIKNIDVKDFRGEEQQRIIIIMLCYLQHPDLPQCDLFDDGIVLRLHKLLDGDDLPRVFVPALEDDTVGALSDLPNLLVLLHPQAGPADIRKGNETLFQEEAGLSVQLLKRRRRENYSIYI